MRSTAARRAPRHTLAALLALEFVYVIPDLDIVVVTAENTTDGHRDVEIDSGRLLQQYVIPSAT